MKLKTRLICNGVAIIVIPLTLIAVAFSLIGYMMQLRNEHGLVHPSFAIFSDQMGEYTEIVDEIIAKIETDRSEAPFVLEDLEYLDSVARSLETESSYIIVRKDEDIFYTNHEAAANDIFRNLTQYGADNTKNENSYYYPELQKMVKQMDFEFSNGSHGSLFVITKINTLINFKFLKYMIMAIAVILCMTAVGLTRWIHVGVFGPIRDLNHAMQNIAEGNFDYVIKTHTKGEIGELYNNYEQMRLRLKESTEEKVQAEAKNKELVSNISHDLKTPITAIKGYVEGIMDGVADTPEKMDKYIRTIYNKAIDMDRLINELTVYSGIDSNRIPYHFQKINVSDYFADCVEEVGVELDSKNIRLNYSNLLDAKTNIIADPEQLKRVINNIISNSVKYMDRRDGMIDIRILDELDSIRVEIEDNGKGIAAKDLGNIFERFYRTDASRNSSTGGSGIGLSIVKKIIEDHGGYIWATSKEGEGTCMHFVIRKYQQVEQEDTVV